MNRVGRRGLVLLLATAAAAALTTGCPSNAETRRSEMKTSRFGAGEEALEAAILADDRAAIASAIAAGAHVNARDAKQVTPLMLAVDRLKQNAVAELLAHRADPNAKAIDGESAVTLAAENYRRAPELIFNLLQAGGDPNSRHQDGDPVIMRFVNDRNCAYIKRMKAFGADMDSLTSSRTPLILSAALGTDWDSVWCLLELGAKYDYPPGPPKFNLFQLLDDPFPSPDSPIYPFKVKVRDFLRAKGLPTPPLRGDAPAPPGR